MKRKRRVQEDAITAKITFAGNQDETLKLVPESLMGLCLLLGGMEAWHQGIWEDGKMLGGKNSFQSISKFECLYYEVQEGRDIPLTKAKRRNPGVHRSQGGESEGPTSTKHKIRPEDLSITGTLFDNPKG